MYLIHILSYFMWVHICFCALHGEAACQLEATTLEELFLSLADGEEACSDLWRCSVFVSTWELSCQATETSSLSPKKAAVWGGGWRVCRGMKLLWISETSRNVYLQEFMHRVFTQVTNFEKMAKVFPLQRLFIPSWTAYWHVTWISIKLLATRGYWKHDCGQLEAFAWCLHVWQGDRHH